MSGDHLGPDARALLAAARFGDDPTSDDADRVRAKIGARIAAGAAVGTATALATKTSAAKAAVSAGAAGIGSKLAVAAIVVGATSATTAVALRQDFAQEAPHVAAAPAPAAPIAKARAIANVLPKPVPVPVPEAAPAQEPAPVAAPPKPARAKPVAAPAPEPVDTIADEAALLRLAREALARGDGASALARVDEHAARFPGGALATEREAARVHALCTAGRASDARAAAGAFVAANPRSPLAPSVRRACATPTPE